MGQGCKIGEFELHIDLDTKKDPSSLSITFPLKSETADPPKSERFHFLGNLIISEKKSILQLKGAILNSLIVNNPDIICIIESVHQIRIRGKS